MYLECSLDGTVFTFSFTSSLSIDLLVFSEIVHLSSSKLRTNSKGTQKINPSLKIQVCRSNKIIQLLIVLLTFYLSISSSSKNWSSDDTFSLPSVLFSLMIVSFVSFMDSLVLPIVL